MRQRVACSANTPFEVLQAMYPGERNKENKERLKLRLGLVKPDVDDWMGGWLDDEGDLHFFVKGTREYNNRRQQTRRFLKKYCLPYKENPTG